MLSFAPMKLHTTAIGLALLCSVPATPMARADAPEEIQVSKEFSEVCPESAVLMVLRLSK